MFGFLLGLIGFLIAAPLDALALMMKKEREKNKPSLISRLTAGKSTKNKSLTDRLGQKVKGTVNKTVGKLNDKVKQKLLLVQELALKASARLIRFISGLIGTVIDFIVAMFGFFIVVAIIVTCIIAYIVGYTKLYLNLVQKQMIAESKKVTHIKKEDDENRNPIWEAFIGENEDVTAHIETEEDKKKSEEEAGAVTPGEGEREEGENGSVILPPSVGGSFAETALNVLHKYREHALLYKNPGGNGLILGKNGFSDCSHFVYDVYCYHFGTKVGYQRSTNVMNSGYPGFTKMPVTPATIAQLVNSGYVQSGDILACDGHVTICYLNTGNISTTLFADFGNTHYEPITRNWGDTRLYAIWRMV